MRASVAGVVLLTLVAATCTPSPPPQDNAGIVHASGSSISRDRPECPQAWDSIPLFAATKGRDTATATVGGWVGRQALGASGPITNIPEFHDCQMFITADGKSYDALYAIFASFKLDTVVNQLNIDSLSWASSDNAVATVNGAGVVTGVTPGAATITGTSTVDPSRNQAFALIVLPGPAGPDSTVYVGPGLPPPPAIRVGQKFTFAMTLAPPTKSTFPVGEVYTYGSGYTALGIGADFNCLYIYFDADKVITAKMVHVSAPALDGSTCATKSDPAKEIGTVLQVVRHLAARDADVPQAARWDFDRSNRQQYIGIKCGAAWCEIGQPGFVSSGDYHAAEGVTKDEARVIENKGWYDQQYLAMYDVATGKVAPTRIKGTVIPHPEPEPRVLKDYENTFVPIAYVALDVSEASAEAVQAYREKYGFVATPVSNFARMNRLDLCLGTASGCGVNPPSAATCAKTTLDQYAPGARWWVKLTPANGGSPKYRCVTRRLHANLAKALWPPVTARWRWLAMDETVWRECVVGCCEVEVDVDAPAW